MKSEDKAAIVTGASRGIGHAITLTFAREGVDVVVDFRTNKKLAEEVALEIERMGRKAVIVQADVRSFEKVREIMDLVVKEFGKVDILVNNAGINMDRAFRKMSKKVYLKRLRKLCVGISPRDI
jgi:3-oxoacyl-[acyl-carrier protein] reductase